ncbi:MAG: hypothetical protein Q8O92_11500 [Candidatus Latescibacter sp.]|nr:hypothetical protein [Candidatus Latescibacter sp.]
MSEELKKLLEAARHVEISSPDAERQRRSFAYGNTKFENERITRVTVDRAAEELKQQNGKKD